MLTPQQANAIVAYAQQHNMTNEEAAAALGIDLGTTAPASTDPWAKFIKPDSRIPVEKLADVLQRDEGLSEVEAFKAALHMDSMAAKPLIDAETARYNERATAAARAEWANTSEGISTLGRVRQAQATAMKEQADSMRPELLARGLPADSMSDSEVVGWVADMEQKRAADAEASSLEANLARVAELDAQREGGVSA